MQNNPDEEGGRLPLQFVWGVIPTDSGNYLDPMSRGQLVYDPSFDITEKDSQTWLLQFCQDLRMQPFYQPTMGPLLANCFIESFRSWMKRRCKDVAGNDHTPCCEVSAFPFSQRVFTRCAARAVAHLHATPRSLFQPSDAGPKFTRGNRYDFSFVPKL